MGAANSVAFMAMVENEARMRDVSRLMLTGLFAILMSMAPAGAGSGPSYGIANLGHGRFAIADGGVQPASGPDRSALVIVDARGKVLERVGRYGNQDGQFRMAHHLAADPDGNVYVVDITGQRVQKFVREHGR